MKLLRIVVGIAAGAVCATVVAWLGLYLIGVFVLHGKGSLFDASRNAENTFFIFWFVLTAVAAVVGGRVAYARAPRASR